MARIGARPRQRAFGRCGASAPPDILNTWSGWGVQPAKGDWSILRGHIGDNLCGGDVALFAWILDWIAHLFQHGTVKPGTALVIKGLKGTGKTKLAEWLAYLCGSHGMLLDKPDQLTGRFNGHLADKIFVCADEATWGGDRTTVGALNTLVTSKSLPIERKGVDITEIPSFHRIMIIGNSDWIVPATKDERRYVVLDISNARKRDREFFAALDKQMVHGGAAAMLHELMARKITRDVGDAPATKALGHQIAQGLTPIDRLLVRIVSEHVLRDVRGNLVLALHETSSASVEKDLLMNVVRSQYPHGFPPRQVGDALKVAGITETRPRLGEGRERMLHFPSSEAMTANIERAFGVPLAVLSGFGGEAGDEHA